MGTNYYFRKKQAQLDYEFTLEKIGDIIQEIKNRITDSEHTISTIKYYLEDDAYDTLTENDIHIGKKSAGWKPLLKRNDELYTNVEELKQYYLDNEDSLIIVDEYDVEMSLDELSDKLLYKGEDIVLGTVDADGYRWTSGELC